MKRGLLLLALIIPAAIFAQTSVNFLEIPLDWGIASTYWAVNDTINGIPVNLGTAGGGNSWNYDYLDSTTNFSQTIVDPDDTPYGNEFPNANLVMETDDLSQFGLAGPGYMYFNLTTSALQLQGLGAEIQGMEIPVVFQNPVNWLTLPLDYNDAWSSNMFYQFFFDSAGMNYRVDLVGTFNEHADAYGTLNLPMGSFPALRVRNDISVTYTVYVIIWGIPIEVMSDSFGYISYMWVSDNTNMCAMIMSQEGETNPNFTTASSFATMADMSGGLFTAGANPVSPPIIIPPAGGSFGFQGSVFNNQSAAAVAQVWTGIFLPSGGFYGPLIQRTVNLAPGSGFSRMMNQSIPGSAPSGSYYYVVRIGDLAQNEVMAQAGFMFTKTGSDAGILAAGSWNCSGWEEEPAVEAALEEFGMTEAYPNPFNSSTTISFDLLQAGEVSLKVYDVQGREIQTLETGGWRLGQNRVVWDASRQSSGVYFVKLSVVGGPSSVKKVVLVK